MPSPSRAAAARIATTVAKSTAVRRQAASADGAATPALLPAIESDKGAESAAGRA